MADVSALPRETLDALEALERLAKRYHTITPEQALAAQHLLLRGQEIEPDADFKFLQEWRQQQQQQQQAAAAAEAEARAAAAAAAAAQAPPAKPSQNGSQDGAEAPAAPDTDDEESA